MIPATYTRVWCVDFEYSHQPGGFPSPLCMVALEIRSKKLVRLWLGDAPQECPVPFGKNDVLVAYLASAELSCFLKLGWQLPKQILDLFVEFNCLTSGKKLRHGRGLLGALLYHDLPAMGTGHKDSMRSLAMRGGAYSAQEKRDLLDYCQSDVEGLALLFEKMAPRIDWPRAIGIRGRYMKAVARMEQNGVPIDTEVFEQLKCNWKEIQNRLVLEVDPAGDIYDWNSGKPVFKQSKFALMLKQMGINFWPLGENGKLKLDKATFKDMSRCHGGKIAQLRELRRALGELRLSSLAVGPDGRNRVMLSPFRSKTSRNQPSNSKFIFGMPKWLRGLVRPKEGKALAYVDWSQQEFAIAGFLSEDARMKEAYQSGDPYLAFAKQSGAAPSDATKETHGDVRAQYKSCVLGVQYGMGAVGLGARLDLGEVWGNHLLRMHKRTYQTFWEWSDRVVSYGLLLGEMEASFGWKYSFRENLKPRSIRNWPMQTAGAEMMRFASILATEAGVKVCAPVHDAFLIEADADAISEAAATMSKAMKKASEFILPGFPLRTDVKIVTYPERLEGDQPMWERVMGLLEGMATSGIT